MKAFPFLNSSQKKIGCMKLVSHFEQRSKNIQGKLKNKSTKTKLKETNDNI